LDKKQIDESIFEALFRQAIIDNFYNELNSIPPLEELAEVYTFSFRHEVRMKRLFVREERKDRACALLKLCKQIAALIVITVTVLFGALMFVPQVRAAVTQTIVSWYQEFVRITSLTSETYSVSLEPAYIPEGFREEFRDVVEVSTVILYLDEKGTTILFESSRASGTLYVDNENAIYDTVVIDNIEYHTFTATEPDGENSIIWDMHGWRYLLHSTISVEYLQNMALSLVP